MLVVLAKRPLLWGTHDEKIGPTQLVAHHHVGIILDHIDG
jgi:hypothetical protein